MYQIVHNPEEYAKRGIICRINLFGVLIYRIGRYGMTIPKEDIIFSNDGCEGEIVRNKKCSAKYCTAKKTIVGSIRE